MKPATFAYHAPATVEEAVGPLSTGEGAQVLAGGQSLVPLMKLRTAKPAALVDVNGVAWLDAIEVHDGELRVGALVRQQALLEIVEWVAVGSSSRGPVPGQAPLGSSKPSAG